MLHQTGSGVLGPVFRAFDLPHDRVVAIKAFHVDASVEARARLADGLRRLASITPPHSSIVLPVAAGIEGSTPFIALPYQSGETLDVVIRRLAPAPPEQVVRLLRGIAEALDSAARGGLGHGLLHPRDIFVTSEGHVSITGTGIARALESAGLPSLVRRPYSAPEREGMWDGRADLFSFGVIAHELLTRRRPAAPGEQDGEFTAQLAPERRVQLRSVLAHAIAADPADRFISAMAFVDALEGAGVGPLAGTFAPLEWHVEGAQPGPRTGLHLDVVPARFPVLLDEAASGRPLPTASDERVEVLLKVGPPTLAAEQLGTRPDIHQIVRSGAVSGPRSRRAAALAGLAAIGLIGAVAGHVAVRVLRPAAPRVTSTASVVGEPAVTETEVQVLPPPAASVETARQPEGVGVDLREAAAVVETVAAEAKAGRLLIRSEPAGALVTVDGKRSGATPAVLNAVPFGAHVVQVARSGYAPRVVRVTLGADAPERRVSVALRPGLQADAAILGGIEIASRPRGARVLIDGRFVGHAPLRVPQLRPGGYTVTLELAGHQSYTGRVGVSAGTLSTLTPTLRSINR